MLFLCPQLSQMQNAYQQICPFHQSNLCVREALVLWPGWKGQLQLPGVQSDHHQAGAGTAINSKELKCITELEEGGNGREQADRKILLLLSF